LQRGLGINHGLTITGYSCSAKKQSTEVPPTQVLQDLLPPDQCEISRPLPFLPWWQVLPSCVSVTKEEFSRVPTELSTYLEQAPWPLVCDGVVSSENQGSWAFSAYSQGKEVWTMSEGTGARCTSNNVELRAISEALLWAR
jgi:hypothetical protein